MEYRANYKIGRHSYFYKDNELLFTFYIKTIFYIFTVDGLFYDEDNNVIFSFRENNFMIGIKLKLLGQNLPHTIEIERKDIDSYNMKVMGKEIYLKITYLSFLTKSFGEFFVDGKSYGKVIKKTKPIETDFIFSFREDDEINYYCMLLFAMQTVGYGNIR